MHPVVFQADLDLASFETLQKESELALDCEMMGLNPIRDRLCVVQIGIPSGHCYLVQIQDGNSAPNLQALLEINHIVKIFHYARLDNLFLKQKLNIKMENIYCTKIASRLARTYTDKHGLKEVIRDLLGVNLDKSNQSSDWGKKELSNNQVHYAAHDVKYLFDIKQKLNEILQREKRQGLCKKLFDFLPTQCELDELQFEHIFDH